MPQPISGRPFALGRTLTSLVLSALLPAQLLPAQAISRTSQPEATPATSTQPLSDQDRRILHLLNRFTFGPTPDEVAEIHSLGPKGIDKWFDLQLHPDRLPLTDDDHTLQARLAEFPSLNLPPDQLIGRFPSNGIIRQAADNKIPAPDDPYLYAIYSHHIQQFKEKQAKKAEEKSDKQAQQPGVAANSAPNMAAGSTMSTPSESQTGESITTAGKEAAPRKELVDNSDRDRARPRYEEVLFHSVVDLPPDKRLQRILYMPTAEFEQLNRGLKPPQRLQLTEGFNPEQRELFADLENPTRAVIFELQAQRLYREIYSSHQLQEVMTAFWLNHFNIYLHKNDETPYYLTSFERDVIRPRALGNFEDLLVATAESPAMLLYLDNSSSTGPDSKVAERQKERQAEGIAKKNTPPGLNENYGRELMELHTLGVNGGYTQKDVTEVSKILTGWTVDHPQLGGDTTFDENRHEPGTKIVMGHKFKEDGMKEGLKLLHMLATSPATAHFISSELAIAFVSDNPPQTLVDRMAKSFESHDGNIAEVLKTLIHSPEFWAPAAYQAKVKTPLEYVVSAVRASNAQVTNPQPLINWLNQLGMPLYACIPPTGYSDKANEWVSTGELVTRMNFALSLANNKLNGITTQWPSTTDEAPDQSANQSIESLQAKLIPTGVSEKTRAAVLTEVEGQSPSPSQITPQSATPKPKNYNPAAAQQQAQQQQQAQIAALLLGSPEFQRR
ncbi:DUF1800 domain-containing protein [Acidicapsa dinghuensis]|uniref:DUF1800 domain-containing protein n=1 Tax=Acidicapsa dinghuensis TaxID=2218256 RepID=A0ABW1EHA1_9BACT|nr:DUF1800 domain-containing protein [Acidicapsa dinghuensis]